MTVSLPQTNGSRDYVLDAEHVLTAHVDIKVSCCFTVVCNTSLTSHRHSFERILPLLTAE